MVEHHLQRQILERLAFASSLRFSELKPTEIENNSFMYHLRQLINAGLVTKTDDGYRLTETGVGYVDRLSLKLHRPRQQPKVIVLVALRNDEGLWLLARHKTQPHRDQAGFISGKQHFMESPETHLQRELDEQLGHDLKLKLERRGWFDIRGADSHVVGLVYSGDYEGPAPPDTVKFSYRWTALNDDLSLTPGTEQISQLLDEGGDFFQLSLDLTAK